MFNMRALWQIGRWWREHALSILFLTVASSGKLLREEHSSTHSSVHVPFTTSLQCSYYTYILKGNVSHPQARMHHKNSLLSTVASLGLQVQSKALVCREKWGTAARVPVFLCIVFYPENCEKWCRWIAIMLLKNIH